MATPTKALLCCRMEGFSRLAPAHGATPPSLAAAGLTARVEVHHCRVTGPVGCTASVHTAVKLVRGVGSLWMY